MSSAQKRSKVAFQETEQALMNLAFGQSAQRVHNFRTRTRRLQTILERLVRDRDRNQKKLLKMLERIRKRAGKVRDLDVQLAALRSLKIPQEPRRKTQLMHGLIELRAKHEKRLCKALTKQTIREIRKRLRKASKATTTDSARDPLMVARKMLSSVTRDAGVPTEKALHIYRIVVKRARYAAELAPPSADAAQFIAQLKRLQDAIGHWHDWLTLTHTATARLGDIHQSPLVAALHNISGAKFRQAVAVLSALPAMQPVPKLASVGNEPLRTLDTKSPRLVRQAETAA